MTNKIQIPTNYQKDIDKAIKILKSAACTDIFLFGSLAAGKPSDGSDIDLAVRGCPPGKYFHLLGQLLLELEHPVDLVRLDTPDAFARHLEQEGALVRIG